MSLTGTPSDDVPAVLATGRTDVTTIYVSLSGRHPDGRDAEYIEWHGLDHQPEQHRLAALRASLRLASTPACRRVRAASDARFDPVDHVMTYLFTDVGQLGRFDELNVAMTEVGRNPYNRGRPVEGRIPGMPLLERCAYALAGMAAAPRVKAGADVLPWRPARGVFLLIERGQLPASELVEVDGVAGAWWASGIPLAPPYATADNSDLQITYCFLDGDPVETAERLRGPLGSRWSEGVAPLLAAPFHTVVPYRWSAHLP